MGTVCTSTPPSFEDVTVTVSTAPREVVAAWAISMSGIRCCLVAGNGDALRGAMLQ